MALEGDQGALQVLIAGSGFAALEAGLALRALAGSCVGLTFVTADAVFRERPAATLAALTGEPVRTWPWSELADDLGAAHRLGRLEAVASQRRTVRLASGERLDYDALILAVGARPHTAVPGAWLFRDQRDVPGFRSLLGRIVTGEVSRVVFAVPPGSAWPPPVYELALAGAWHARAAGVSVAITLVTPEPTPLSVFGPWVSREIAQVLDEHEVRFLGERAPVAVRRDGALELRGDGALAADAVVTVPQLRGHRISGVPGSWWGFVPTDANGRAEGLSDVYAAGDMCAFPVKQAGLAAQQADRIAHTIATGTGITLHEPDARAVLQARLVGGDTRLRLRTELDWRGRPTSASLHRVEEIEPDAVKVFGRYVTPYLEQRTPSPV